MTKGYNLSSWLTTQKQKYRTGRLAADQVAQLHAYGIDPKTQWSVDPEPLPNWADQLRAVTTWQQAYGHLDIPIDHRDDGLRPGIWLARARTGYRAGTLPADQAVALDELGIDWQTTASFSDMCLISLRDWLETSGHSNVSRPHVTAEGLKLGAWLMQCRSAVRKDNLNPDIHRALIDLGVQFETRSKGSWDRAIEELTEYARAQGNPHPSHKHVTDSGYGLGGWLTAQRRHYRAGMLAQECLRRNVLHSCRRSASISIHSKISGTVASQP